MRTALLLLTLATVATPGLCADEPTPMKSKLSELIREDAEAAKGKPGPLIIRKPTPKAEPRPMSPAPAPVELKTQLDPKTGEKVEVMPAITVDGSRMPQVTPSIIEAQKKIADTEKKIAREKENTKATDADLALNSEKYSYFGELSAKGREDDAKRRIQELELKQAAAATVADPAAEEENKKTLKMLDDLEYQKKR